MAGRWSCPADGRRRPPLRPTKYAVHRHGRYSRLLLAAPRRPPQRQPPRLRGAGLTGRTHHPPHPLSPPHGPDSPVGRVHELGGYVLLLGVGHDANTTIHLAEHMAGVRYRRRKHATIMQDGAPTRFEYEEIDHCCERFALVDGWLGERGLQRRGVVGHAEALCPREQSWTSWWSGCVGTRRHSSIPSAQTQSAPTLEQACGSDYRRKSLCHAS